MRGLCTVRSLTKSLNAQSRQSARRLVAIHPLFPGDASVWKSRRSIFANRSSGLESRASGPAGRSSRRDCGSSRWKCSGSGLATVPRPGLTAPPTSKTAPRNGIALLPFQKPLLRLAGRRACFLICCPGAICITLPQKSAEPAKNSGYAPFAPFRGLTEN